MKTYYSNEFLGRLVSYLVAVGYPFHFDGTTVEFTASESFFERMVAADVKLREIIWVVK